MGETLVSILSRTIASKNTSFTEDLLKTIPYKFNISMTGCLGRSIVVIL